MTSDLTPEEMLDGIYAVRPRGHERAYTLTEMALLKIVRGILEKHYYYDTAEPKTPSWCHGCPSHTDYKKCTTRQLAKEVLGSFYAS